MEIINIGFEAIKQLITLNAGSILIIGTFLSDIFPTNADGTLAGPRYMAYLVGAAFVNFGLSLIVAVLAMFVYQSALVLYVEEEESFYENHVLRHISWVTILGPFGFYAVGLICFGLAVLLNIL
jgi:hypothetical protein